MPLCFVSLEHLALTTSLVDPEMDVRLPMVRTCAAIATCNHCYFRTGVWEQREALGMLSIAVPILAVVPAHRPWLALSLALFSYVK